MKAHFLKFSIIYFVIGITEVIAEFFAFNQAIIILKPLIPLMLMIVYRMTSTEQNPLFFATMFFSFLTNLLFLPIGPDVLFYAVIAFTVHRILFIYCIVKMLKIKDFIPIAIGFVPFFFLFSYVFKFADEVSNTMYAMIILQNFLISALGGIALSNYIMKDDSKNSWLYMCGLLFVLLQFVIFIERYYIMISIFRPIAMLLNVSGFYCFYRFFISTETSNNNGSS